MLVVRLKHLTIRHRCINRLEKVPRGAHVKHKEERVGWDGLACFCPEGIVGDRGASNVGYKRHASVGRQRLHRCRECAPNARAETEIEPMQICCNWGAHKIWRGRGPAPAAKHIALLRKQGDKGGR